MEPHRGRKAWEGGEVHFVGTHLERCDSPKLQHLILRVVIKGKICKRLESQLKVPLTQRFTQFLDCLEEQWYRAALDQGPDV
jgi:hypothetical protein